MSHFDELWKESYSTSIKELQGTFDVKILSGWFKLLGMIYLVWQKIIGNDRGSNLQNKNEVGHFILSEILDKDDRICIYFDYNQLENVGFWLNLQDHVRQISKNYFIGQIYLKIRKKYRFMGYFSLLRIETEKNKKENK